MSVLGEEGLGAGRRRRSGDAAAHVHEVNALTLDGGGRPAADGELVAGAGAVDEAAVRDLAQSWFCGA